MTERVARYVGACRCGRLVEQKLQSSDGELNGHGRERWIRCCGCGSITRCWPHGTAEGERILREVDA